MNLKTYLELATIAYNKGEPFISDEEYNALERMLGEQLIVGDSDSYVPHYQRMYSLKKHYPTDPDHGFVESQCVRTPKLDGLASSILYLGGELDVSLTRGDGVRGRPITDKMSFLVPTLVNTDYPVIQITGEIVASAKVENSRNQAAGSLGLLEGFEDRAKELGLEFIAYDVVGGVFDTFIEKMQYLSSLGFRTILDVAEDEFPTDGVVLRLNSESEFKRLGYTDKFPRGAIALKTVQETKHTKLLDVIWQTGSSGRVTPVAILEPVELGGAKVSRATLNNIAYIQALGLEIGDTVEVVRSGEIIPKIVGKITV